MLRAKILKAKNIEKGRDTFHSRLLGKNLSIYFGVKKRVLKDIEFFSWFFYLLLKYGDIIKS